mgnify:CR=1 FL=1
MSLYINLGIVGLLAAAAYVGYKYYYTPKNKVVVNIPDNSLTNEKHVEATLPSVEVNEGSEPINTLQDLAHDAQDKVHDFSQEVKEAFQGSDEKTEVVVEPNIEAPSEPALA